MPANRNVTSIETYSGQYVDLINPDPATIKLEDIAVHLANTVRFAGGVTKYYSVAEHAVRVSYLVQNLAAPEWREHGLWPALALAALHHDSHEFVLGDVPAPLKAVLRKFEGAYPIIDTLAASLDSAIIKALGIEQDMHDPRIKAADDEAMYREAAALKWSHGVGAHWNNDKAYTPWAGMGWSPQRAERTFYNRHLQLTGEARRA